MKISKKTVNQISHGLLYVVCAYFLTCLAVKGIYTYLQPLTPAQAESKKQAKEDKERFEDYLQNKQEFKNFQEDRHLYQEYQKQQKDFETYRKWKSQNSSYMNQPKFADLTPEIEPESQDDDSLHWIMETYCHIPMCGTQMDPCVTVGMYLICLDT